MGGISRRWGLRGWTRLGEWGFVRFAIVVGIRRFAIAMVGFTRSTKIGRPGYACFRNRDRPCGATNS